ncbi:MAG: methyltransferase domain-containing protein [Patescibacteria group bacterium]|jgi:cyclopropane fatty-acyl-phospholipid synthase-like methyltransferase|nr:methyltransferase domain-containing protein [Patescibacteria group bacterium]
MQDISYEKSFNLFLKNTNEKTIILKFINKNVKLDKKNSFLDIGGGDGTLASVIAYKVKDATIIEPNYFFVKKIKKIKNINVINDRWENVDLKKKFDFILAAYVVTYFSETKRKLLIKKMYKALNVGGKIIILSVDSEKGSWRKIHTFFYKLMNHKHKSSDKKLKKIVKNYCTKTKTFKTYVVTKNIFKMLSILEFDFLKYPNEFKKYKKNLAQFLSKYQNKDSSITLEMVHNAHIIIKNK